MFILKFDFLVLLYFGVLATFCLKRWNEPEILYCRISRLVRFNINRSLDAKPGPAPQSTITPYIPHQPPLPAPKAMRPGGSNLAYAYRGGMGSEYEIEHYEPHTRHSYRQSRWPETRRLEQSRQFQGGQNDSSSPSPPPVPVPVPGAHPYSSMYPQYLQSVVRHSQPPQAEPEPDVEHHMSTASRIERALGGISEEDVFLRKSVRPEALPTENVRRSASSRRKPVPSVEAETGQVGIHSSPSFPPRARPAGPRRPLFHPIKR